MILLGLKEWTTLMMMVMKTFQYKMLSTVREPDNGNVGEDE